MVKTNLRGVEATADWKAYGYPLLCDVLRTAKLESNGRAAVTVRDCHYRKPRKCRQPIRIRREDVSLRLVTLAITPFDSRYWFQVDIVVARGLVFKESLDLIRQAAAAAEDNNNEDECADQPEEATVIVPVPTDGQTQRLMKMRDGITLLLQTGQQLRELQEERDKAAAEHERATRETLDLNSRVLVARDHRKRTAERITELKKECEELSERLAAAGRARQAAFESLAEAEAKAAKLEAEWQPHGVRLNALRQTIEHADTLIAEQKAAAGKAGDMSLILAALEKLG